MGTKTSNYNLIKPSQEDFYNIEDQNANMDIIDAQLKSFGGELSSHLSDSVIIELSEIEPLVPDKNMYWYKIGSFSEGMGGGDGVSVSNAVTGDDPPTQSQYWFDPL